MFAILVIAAVALASCGGAYSGEDLDGPGVAIQSYPSTLACCDPGISCAPCGHIHAGQELADANALAEMQRLHIKWYDNYKSTPIGIATPGIKFAPMIFGHANVNSTEISNAVKNSTSGWLLGFNEPQNAYPQANMTVAQALSDWPQLEATGLKLCAPATGSPDIASGPHNSTDWFADWAIGDANRDGVGNDGGYTPRFDAICWHYYTSTFNNNAAVTAQILAAAQTIASRYHKKVILTELGMIGFSGSDPSGWAYPTTGQAQSLLPAEIVMFRQHRDIFMGWAPYPNVAMSDLQTDAPGYNNITLGNLDGTLTILGGIYAVQ